MKIPALRKERKQLSVSPERLREHRRVKRMDFLNSMCFMAPSFLGVLIFFILRMETWFSGKVIWSSSIRRVSLRTQMKSTSDV